MGATSSLPKNHPKKSVSCGFLMRSKNGRVEDSTTSQTMEASSSSCGNLALSLNDSTNLPTAEEQIRHCRRRRRKDLPSTGEFSSCHVMINRERVRLGKEQLYRCVGLDSIAQQRAERMAKDQKLIENPIDNETMVENVQRGHSIRIIQQLTMGGVCDSQRDNILSDKFTSFGIGCVTGDDGMIYMSQVFHTAVPSSSLLSSSLRISVCSPKRQFQSHRSL